MKKSIYLSLTHYMILLIPLIPIIWIIIFEDSVNIVFWFLMFYFIIWFLSLVKLLVR